ncbi:molybdopterin binding domain protein [Desulfofarcimen acetoxidans DSM 771]|uniref:Molybdopterin molybdenumtransferase n=1 Tax=Desulfofarcimen acetoxidans (strain ATCC 49208 / DSM 771 / KCTC 5769 / VKM B-1644 / 5575) TaxID=485916 RepID=C8W6Q5_DESAS|nr:molybdopterin-binding protein [Desulfofarcimen acetoxidans]ACV64164.1 molybdopterin binding domain protein [Desulfofarcimen acetoxidans DSM 771]
MKVVAVEEAVGMVLGHDITQIVPGKVKGPAFKKGHVIEFKDIPKLLNIGKENIYVFDLQEGFVHEDDAALRIAEAAAGPGIEISQPKEGRVNLTATVSGLLKINAGALFRINEIDEAAMATLHTNHRIDAGSVVAGTRIIPLVIEEEKLASIINVCRENYPIAEVKPFKPWKIGVVTTGSEVYRGRIKDKFGPVLKSKFSLLGSTVLRQIFVSDDVQMTAQAVHDLIDEGADMIAVTGGMSVDPDDQTPAGIRAAGGEVVIYGTPCLPGSMFMLAYINDTPVVGLPGCVMYNKASIFDLVVPRILAGEEVTKEDIIALGHGGLCSGCPECRYPVCGFGKV